MVHKSDDAPSRVFVKAPNETLAEKLTDTLQAIVERSKKVGNDSVDASER
jgi:hypothetical protein